MTKPNKVIIDSRSEIADAVRGMTGKDVEEALFSATYVATRGPMEYVSFMGGAQMKAMGVTSGFFGLVDDAAGSELEALAVMAASVQNMLATLRENYEHLVLVANADGVDLHEIGAALQDAYREGGRGDGR